MKEKIINYLKETYNPLSILVYGSYRDGTNDEYSDFDCLIIVDEKKKNHDDSKIDGVRLDCFIYTKRELEEEKDLFPVTTVYDAEIALDDGTGKVLKNRVIEFVKDNSDIGEDEREFIISWTRKTIERFKREDLEGNYRAVAFLSESLEDYFLLRSMFYFGSKKSMRKLKEMDEVGYVLYIDAITKRSNEAIEKWALHVIDIK